MTEEKKEVKSEENEGKNVKSEENEENAKVDEIKQTDEQKVIEAQKIVEAQEREKSVKCLEEIEVVLKKYNRALGAVPQIRVAPPVPPTPKVPENK